MNVFAAKSYVQALEELVRLKKETAPSFTMAKLAQAARMQPSYLTNVLKKRGHFNSDQLYLVCQYLGLSDDETDYLLSLLEFEKTVVGPRKAALENKIKQVQAHKNKTENQLKAKPVKLNPEHLELYYLDPFVQLIHIYLGFHPDSGSLEKIGKAFGISREHTERCLATLIEIGYIEKTKSGYKVKVEGRHLSKDSPICGAYLTLMRLKSLDQLQRLTPREKYSFSATISTSPEIRTKIENEFIKFLKTAEKLVGEGPNEEMYQMSFDLFPWQVGLSQKA